MFYFILHLSIADLLTAFFTLLPEVVWTLTFPDFHGGVIMCKFVKFTQMLGPYLSSYILIMTAVDRYQAICNPLGNCTWTPKRSKVRFLFSPINEYFFNKLDIIVMCCKMHFDAPSRFRKGWMISILKKQ